MIIWFNHCGTGSIAKSGRPVEGGQNQGWRNGRCCGTPNPRTAIYRPPFEWATIRLRTNKKGWTEPQHKMMRRAGRIHGVRGVLALALLAGGVLAVIAVRRHVIENQRVTHGAGLVERLLDADTPQVPDIVRTMREYRQWVDPSLASDEYLE